MIFTHDFVTRENHWQITPLVTKKSLFTVTNALFFISLQSSEDFFIYFPLKYVEINFIMFCCFIVWISWNSAIPSVSWRVQQMPLDPMSDLINCTQILRKCAIVPCGTITIKLLTTVAISNIYKWNFIKDLYHCYSDVTPVGIVVLMSYNDIRACQQGWVRSHVYV